MVAVTMECSRRRKVWKVQLAWSRKSSGCGGDVDLVSRIRGRERGTRQNGIGKRGVAHPQLGRNEILLVKAVSASRTARRQSAGLVVAADRARASAGGLGDGRGRGAGARGVGVLVSLLSLVLFLRNSGAEFSIVFPEFRRLMLP